MTPKESIPLPSYQSENSLDVKRTRLELGRSHKARLLHCEDHQNHTLPGNRTTAVVGTSRDVCFSQTTCH